MSKAYFVEGHLSVYASSCLLKIFELKTSYSKVAEHFSGRRFLVCLSI